ncbi:unnamed protein product [Kuraishia capsulata CBS 1993]|uniref:Uncharacterized protein n=1 Tax=Kuraishia capsulata CBS 1993 TaxID=1382522 RepID=W6MGW0_9ASCO|nr:uncharacterized protein KUCA_T00001404001 [Kuraishia capsulata CBS 1993]CDK25434.1 unnamed protein product [Kuraishia capsulata CBS 1993]
MACPPCYNRILFFRVFVFCSTRCRVLLEPFFKYIRPSVLVNSFRFLLLIHRSRKARFQREIKTRSALLSLVDARYSRPVQQQRQHVVEVKLWITLWRA